MERKNNAYTVRVSDSFNRETEETIHYMEKKYHLMNSSNFARHSTLNLDL